jgi:hypothetical protein
MDTSPEYVKMCAAATEIQKTRIEKGRAGLKRFLPDDFYYHSSESYRQYGDGISIAAIRRFAHADPEVVWLPRQDQCQEMVQTMWPCGFTLPFRKFIAWIDNMESHETMIGGFNSMEQLWLAFVMYQKHKKTWTGETWRIQ